MLGDYRKLSSKNHTSHEDKSGLHYRMYKSGKTWLFSSLFAVAIFGASTLTAQADTNTDQADSSQVATISSSSASSSAVVLNSASATSESASADATSIATNSTADSQSTSSESSNQSSATSNETSSAVVAETSDASSTASSASNTSTASSATVAASDATSINSDSSISAASAGTASSSSATTSSASGSQSVTSLSSAADSVTLSGASSNSADLNTVTLINPSSDAIADAKTSAEQAYALTGQAQEVQAVADDTTTNVTVTLNATAVGYNTGVSSLIVTVSVTNPVAGETYTINFPATTAVIQSYSYQDLSSVGGTSTWTKNSDGTYTLVGTFNSSKTGVVSQVITVSLLTNAWANSNPMQEIGTTTKTITYSVDGVDQTPLTFTQTITPGLNSNFGTTTRTNTATSTGVQPNTDYIYTFKVGEWNGVSDSSNASNIINSAANYGGTTITIPVPAGFVLDSSMTQALNVGADGTNYLAGTTITQPDGPGGNIIITASAASGKQGWNTPSGYQIVGYYTTTQTSANQTLAASGPATFTQVINAAGDTLTGTGTTVWTDTLIGTATATTNTGTVTLNGNSSSASTTLSLGTSTPPATLNSFTLTNTSTSSSTNASLTVSIPNGFNVTTITTPTSVNNSSYYMNGTTSYSYVITLADGTQENGIVDAGSSITSADGSAIRTAVITPNYLAAGAKSGSFTLVGTLSTTYDNGSAVNIGDKLTTTVTLNFGGSSTAAATKSVTQTVAEAYTNVYAYVHQTSQVPGATNSGFMSLQQIGSNPHTTNLVYEPIFYYVIPTSTTIYKVANTGDAKVSYSTTDDGRTLVIIDYTGTGDYVDMTTGSGYVQVALSNNSDALPGQYKYYMYVDSPTTKINNTGAAADLSYVNGDTNAVTIAIGNWTLNSAGIFTDYSYAQGNEDTDAVTSGTADTHGDSTVTFYTSVVNTSASSTNTTATEVVNLPTVGDSQGSQYNFELTGPITVPTNYTTAAGTGTAITATVLYSTSLQSIDANSTSPDTTGYVTADQVTDWSAIRSVIIELTGISSNTSTGRIAFIGTVEDFQSQAGNTGYLETAIYVGTSKPSISSKGTAAQLSIEGQSTVYARLHYTLNGQDVYVDLPDLTQTLNENVDVLQDIYPTTESGFSATDQALFPAGYTLVANSMHIVGADGGVGSAVIGDVAQFSYDGNYVQYELIGDSNLDITYVDDDEGGIQVGDTVTVNGPSGSAGSYTLVIPDGYKLADTQDITINDDTISFTYTAGDTPLTIHLVHDTTVTDMTTTNTVSYTGLPDKDAQASKSTTVNWTVTVDPVLNTTTYVPDSTTTSIVSPTVEGYTPSQSTVTFSQGSGATEPTSQSAVVTYTADSETATVNYVDDVTGEIVKTDSISGFTDDTGTYTVDLSDINSGYRLASGQSSSVDYTLAANNGTTLTINLTHHLTHSTTTSTQTINYVILNGDGTASSDQSKAPASHTQNLTWKVVTDDVTGTSYATAEATGYPAVTSPTVDGYTPSANEVDYSYPAPTATANVKDTTETINYTPDAETATVTYVDDVTGETVKTATINGVTDESGTYTADLSGLNSGYRLAAGQNATEDYTITTDDSDNLTIHLTHHLTNSTTTSTQTINYVILNGDGTVSTDQTKAPASHTQNLTWKVVTDDVTGTSYATAEATGYPAVTSPTVNGYTPSASEVDYSYPAPTATANVKDTTETINYTPDAETATVTYVDDVTGETVKTDTINGVTDESGTYTADLSGLNSGYRLAAGQSATEDYTITTDDSDNLTIHLTHHLTNSTTTSTQTINYVILNGDGSVSADQSKAPASHTQNLTWKVVTDDVTGTSYATAEATGYPAVTSPTVTGYTPSASEVDYSYPAPTATANVKDTTETINYTPDAETATVTYVDDVTGETVKTDTINGVTDESGTYTADLSGLNSGYRLAAGQSATEDYTITTDDSDNLTIHLTHHLTNSTTTSTQTINYVILNGDGTASSDQSKAPASHTQNLTWKVVTDDVTGASYATAEAIGYPAVTSPTVDGYTPSASEVDYSYPAPTATANVKDTTETINYTPDAETATVTYVDDVTGETVKTATINGVTDESGTYTADLSDLNSGYRLAAGQSATEDYTITTDDSDNLTIHLTHHLTNSTTTSTQTINYVILNGDGTASSDQSKAPASHTQNLTWKVVTDDVTGASYANAESTGYPAVTSPTVTGYTPSASEVDYSYPAPTATANVKDATETINYTPDAETATVTYVDDVTGETVKTATINGVTDESGTYSVDLSGINSGYRLAAGQNSNVAYTITPDDSGNITIHLTHSIVDGTATTTRTITYVIADGDKSKTPKTVTQTMSWKTVTDEVTGTSYATAQNAYEAVTTPTIAGYTADKASIAEVTEGNLPTNELTNTSETVTYTADEQSVTITYVDSQTGKVVKTITITGKTDSTLTVPELAGYTIDSTNLPTSFEAGVDSLSVLVTPVNNGNNSGNGGSTITTPGNNHQSTGSTNSGTNSSSDGENGNSNENTNVISKANDKQPSKTKQQPNQNKLPQTGDEAGQEVGLTILGLMTGMLGLIGLKRRKRDDD